MNQIFSKMVIAFWPIWLILAVSVVGIEAGAKCFNCGYITIEGQEPKPLPGDIPFCLDKPSFEDQKKTCDKTDDCCSIVHVTSKKEDNTLAVATYHGCADEIPKDQASVDCEKAEPGIDESKCIKSDQDQGDDIEEDTEICTCTDELCNSYNFPTEEPGSSTSPPDGISCYQCGYLIRDGGDPEAVSPDVPLCSADGGQQGQLETCVKGDCCAVVETSYYGPQEGEGQKNVSYFEVYHGCKNDLHIHNHDLEADCAKAGDQIEEKNCVVENVHEGEMDIELNVCVCKSDACNQWSFPTNKPGSTTENPGKDIECFTCGYQKIDDGPPEKIDNKPFCLDEAQPGAHVQTCKRGDDCCVEIHVKYTEEFEKIGPKQVEQVWHACKDEVDILGFQTEISCDTAPNEIDPDMCAEGHVANENAEVSVCACTNTICNSYPAPSSQAPASSSEGPHKTCYNCGYRQVDDGDAEPLPDEDQSYFCGDTVAPNSKTTDCIGATDDCCAIVFSYSIIYDEAQSKNTTVRTVRHGCYNELAIHEHHSIQCSEASDVITRDCKVFDQIEDNDNVFKEEICLCKKDFCNNKLPDITTAQPPTTQGGGATSIKAVASSVMLLSIILIH